MQLKSNTQTGALNSEESKLINNNKNLQDQMNNTTNTITNTNKSSSQNGNNNLNILNNLNKKSLNNNSNQNKNTNDASSSSSSSSSSTTSNQNDSNENTTESKTKIGIDYQADLSKYDPKLYFNTREKLKEKECPIWKPSDKLNDKQLEDYLTEASNKYSYNIEQALALLFWNKHNIPNSLADMKKYIPKPNEWTQEEKILFEQAYCFNGKNFTKIRQVLPDKSQASLVTYYYMWKKARLFTSQIENQQNNSKNSYNNLELNGLSELNENGVNNDDIEMNNSDDNDSVDDNFNNNVNKICCNCDLITNDLQSTPKGQLCNPCYVYYKETGGLMRPDHLINKSANHQQSLNYNSFKTNRYLNISSTTNNDSNNNNTNNNNNNNGINNISKEARNFYKSLRKPPKGIYLNHDELVDLVQTGPSKVFEDLSRKIKFLRKQTQLNKQDIEALIKQIPIECDNLKSEIDNLLFKNEEEEEESSPKSFWTHKEVKLVLQAFNKYGDDFEAISQIIQTKSSESIRAFYSYYRENLNLDKLISNNVRELNKKAASIISDLKKLNRPDLPVIRTNESINQSDDIIVI